MEIGAKGVVVDRALGVILRVIAVALQNLAERAGGAEIGAATVVFEAYERLVAPA